MPAVADRGGSEGSRSWRPLDDEVHRALDGDPGDALPPVDPAPAVDSPPRPPPPALDRAPRRSAEFNSPLDVTNGTLFDRSSRARGLPEARAGPSQRARGRDEERSGHDDAGPADRDAHRRDAE